MRFPRSWPGTSLNLSRPFWIKIYQMIYVKKPDLKEKEFLDLLEKSRLLLLASLKTLSEKVTPASFENLVFEKMVESSKGTRFEGLVDHTKDRVFPDILAGRYFGAEVKMTTNDHWTSTGNSILESSRVPDVQKIYIIFGKLGGKPSIRYRKIGRASCRERV